MEKVKEAYDHLFQLRNLENSLLWTRINILLIIQGFLLSFLATTFISLKQNFPSVLILVEFFGLLASFFLWYITKGGIFWVSYWEDKLAKIEGQVIGNIDIFRNHIASDKIRQKQVKGYASVRDAIKLFSALFIIIWIILIAITVL